MTAATGPPYLLGIDIGTTNLKANLYDVAGRRVAAASRPTVAGHPHPDNPDWAEYSPEALWQATAANIREVVGQVPDARQIKALAVVGMGEPIIPVDRRGDWLYPAICWFDRRTEPQAQWWREHVGARRVYGITGQPVSFFLSLNAMLWLREHEPEVFRRAHRWLVVEDYVMFKLAGVYATDYSIASRTMGFDVQRKCWSEEVFAAAALDPAVMALPHPSGTAVGSVTESAAAMTGLAPGTVVATGGHDHGCTSLPANVLGPDSVLNSTGTADVMLGVLPEARLTEAAHAAAIPVYPHPLPDRYQVMDCILFGATALDWYLERFGGDLRERAVHTGGNVYDLLLAGAEQADARADGLIWLPNVRGTPTDPAVRGAFLGIRDSHTGGDFVRAILEGICYEVRARIDQFERLFDADVQRVVAVGGASRSPFWSQLRADVTGRTVEVLDTDEAASLGGAMLAGIAAGIYPDHEAAVRQVYRVQRRFAPDPRRREQYDECYRRVYRRCAASLRGVDAELAGIFPPEI
ncbi:MAG: FGGY family carbohydrate kinase [Spirochaetaceae bacterium]|nr:FGGY family carbohydrate kinase [Spirochaetaceae bacterium]